ncbi:MAG: hypothetical protein ACTFAK_15790 [Candidatus Electronema sp. VV]
MKRILAGLIGGVALTALAFGTAMASGDEYYEHNGGYEAYEHGGYYNPYGSNYGYNNNYRNHELREYGGRYMNSVPVYGGNYYGSGYIDDDAYKYNNYGYNSGYRNHEMYEYRR